MTEAHGVPANGLPVAGRLALITVRRSRAPASPVMPGPPLIHWSEPSQQPSDARRTSTVASRTRRWGRVRGPFTA